MKKVVWVGNSKEDLKRFPEKVKRAVGHALHLVQEGEKPPRSKVLSGFGMLKYGKLEKMILEVHIEQSTP